MPAGYQPDRVAIWIGIRDHRCTDIAARVRLCFDHERLPQSLRERIGDDTRKRVSGSACRKSMQQPDWPIWVAFGGGHWSRRGQQAHHA